MRKYRENGLKNYSNEEKCREAIRDFEAVFNARQDKTLLEQYVHASNDLHTCMQNKCYTSNNIRDIQNCIAFSEKPMDQGWSK